LTPSLPRTAKIFGDSGHNHQRRASVPPEHAIPTDAEMPDLGENRLILGVWLPLPPVPMIAASMASDSILPDRIVERYSVRGTIRLRCLSRFARYDRATCLSRPSGTRP